MFKQKWTFHKIVLILNILAAAILLFSYALPYLPPKSFPRFSLLTFGLPILMLINVLFVIFWFFRKKIFMLLSGITLIIGINYILSFYKFAAEKDIYSPRNISLLTYNVHNFNIGGWTKQDSIPQKIKTFITAENPDIVFFQEYFDIREVHYENYPYKYFSSNHVEAEMAIFSKYPIINKGTLDFKNTGNNVIYADIVAKKDTLRVFNMHLQSHGIPSQFAKRYPGQNKNIFRNVGIGLMKQQEQVHQVLEEVRKSPYKSLIAGDSNNSVFSYTYRQLNKEFKDAFKEAGHGLGRSFYFNHIPIRMDWILVDPDITINNFKTYDVRYSDHFPVSTKFEL